MTSASVAICADDFTGAADAVAAFVAHGSRGTVALSAADLRAPAAGSAVALDASSRERSLRASGAAAAAARHLAGADVAFLKVDSLLRGCVADDIATMMEHAAWPRVVVAPAFPAHGRALIGGRLVAARGERLGLLDALAARGLRPTAVDLAELRGTCSRVPKAGPLVVDAETDADLARVVSLPGDGPTLWVGSAGLARALASRGDGPAPPPAAAVSGPVLVVVGSRTALARRQVEVALRRHSRLARVEAPPGVAAVGEAVRAALAGGRDPLVCVSPTDGEDDVRVVGRLAAEIAPLRARAAALVVVGGETARGLLLACGVRALDVTGELEPGIATALDPDGRPVLTKSGSFGDDGALARMYEWSRAPLGVA